MNYIELINKFWLTNESHSFRTTDIALFFYLLKINNACSWKEYFKRKNIQIQADLDISYNTLKEARNRLKQAKLLDFKSKNGSGDVSYTLSNFDEVIDKVNPKDTTSSKNDEVTDKVTTEVGSEVTTEVTNEVALAHINGTCNQTKLNETKEFIPNIGDTAFSEVSEKGLSECFEQLSSDQMWLEAICMNTRGGGETDFTMDKLKDYLLRFFRKLQNEGESVKYPRDAQSHFARWLDIKLKEERNDRARAKKIESTRNSTGKAKCTANIQPAGTSQKDYSGKF